MIVLFIKISDLNERLFNLEQQLKENKSPGVPMASVAVKTKVEDSPVKILQPHKTEPVEKTEKKLVPEQGPKQTKERPVLVDNVIAYFSSGNVIAKLGVVILFFGIIFLLKYAVAHNMFPLSLRLIGASVLAFVFLGLGIFLQSKKREYGLVLQGCGIGLLYIICFISYRVYHLMPSEMAFILLLIVGILAATIALKQNSMSLILIAQIGGFMTPFLAAGPQGSELILFSYFALLNMGIATIVWFKAWRVLNVLGFTFTFVLASFWGFWQYQPQHYLLSQLFLIFFTVLYSVITVLFSRQQQRINPKYYIDNILLFSVPLFSFLLQTAIVHRGGFSLGLSDLAYGVFYAALASLLLSTNRKLYKLLSETYLYIASVFLLLAILFSFSQEWVGLLWVLAILPILFIGIRSNRTFTRLFAEIILGSTMMVGFFIYGVASILDAHIITLINGALMGLVGILAASIIAKHKGSSVLERNSIAPILFILGVTLWFVFSVLFFYSYHVLFYGLLYFSLSTWIWCYLACRFKWVYLDVLAILLVPLCFIYFLKYSLNFSYVNGGECLVWIGSIVSQYWLLSKAGRFNLLHNTLAWLHTGTYCLMVLVLSSLIMQWFDFNLQLNLTWQSTIGGLLPLMAIGAIMMGVKHEVWPFKVYPALYSQIICAIIISVVYWWTLLANLFLWDFPQN
jgi:uncharacterized membrane protein